MNPTLLKNLAVIFIYSPFGPTPASLVYTLLFLNQFIFKKES